MATNEKVMKEASEHARLADEANERAAEKEASARKLREQADKLSAEAAEERALAGRELAAAQAALRDGGIGTNPPPAGSVLHHERTAMDDRQMSSSEKDFPWRILAAVAAVIIFLLALAWLWPFGTKTSAAEKLEVPISGLRSEVGVLSTKVDGLGSAIKGVDGKLDTLKGEVGALKDCACDKKEPPKAPARPRAAKPAKPAAVVPQPSAKLPPPPVESKFWGWVHPEATAANKRTCYADRRIIGMPVQCSSVELFPREGNETEVQWNARVAAKNGIYVGAKDEKGVITGTKFGRVHVK